MIGVILSLFIGLIFKSQIRSSVVKARLQQVIVKLQKDVNIDFESVEVRLSEWGIPRPVIEIRGVRISPLKANCQENQIYIDNLSFPLSFNLLFSPDKVISTVRISLLEVRAKNTRQCFSKNTHDDSTMANREVLAALPSAKTKAETATAAAAAEMPKRESTKEALEKLRNFKSHLNEVKIDRLRVIAVDKMNTAVDFNAVQLMFKYEQEKLSELTLQSQLSAFKESDKSYYLFKSDLKINLRLDEKPTLNAEVKGLVVDRPFHLKFKNDLQKNSIQFLGELNGISLKAINYIVKVERPQTEIFDFLSGSSMTGYLTGEYYVDDRKYEANLKDIKIILGGGIAEINDIFVIGKADEKAQVKPFDVQLSHIELTKILSHRVFDNIRPSIQNAGYISGLIQFMDVNQFKVKSLIEKTSFVFSNKGERVPQIFDSFNLHASVDPQKINLNINDFILDSQKIHGTLKYSHQTETGDKSLSVDLEGHLLKPDTVKLFTGKASDPEIKLLFTSDLKNNLKGTASIDKISINQFDITKLALEYEKNLLLKSEFYNVKTGGLTVAVSDRAQSSQLNVLFDQILPKPAVSFTQSKLQIQRDGLGKLNFNLKGELKNKTDLLVVGEYAPSIAQLSTKGNFKNQNFNIIGPLDKLVATPIK
ncbi:hypothetical protein CIK05_07690 [Bdellovibrio sp. qaytius]|nr:hypothetical protein CIK05_07690 [Bdellovibrio sp. qaytius]